MQSIVVKQESGTPWAHELVVQDGEVVQVKQEPQEATPWGVARTKNSRHQTRDHAAPDERLVWQADEKDIKATPKTKQVKRARKAPEKTSGRSPRLLSTKNYAAVDAESTFGLIPTGGEMGVQSLIMHAHRGVQGWESFREVRPGAILRVVRKAGEKPTELRVRFTTPTRYIPPGAKISCMTIGVDEAEWRSLMSNPRCI